MSSKRQRRKHRTQPDTDVPVKSEPPQGQVSVEMSMLKGRKWIQLKLCPWLYRWVWLFISLCAVVEAGGCQSWQFHPFLISYFPQPQLISPVCQEFRRAGGPRIKHVCRAASVVLGQPRALVPDDIPRLSALPLHERSSISPSAVTKGNIDLIDRFIWILFSDFKFPVTWNVMAWW